MIAMTIINFISAAMYPLPDTLDLSDSVAMSAYIAQLPILAKLMVLLGWIVAAFVAGFVAAKLAPEGKSRQMAMIAGAILMLGGIINAFMLPHPMWMLIIGLLQYIPLAHIGAKAAGK
jgi:hypothetical protein